MADHVTGDHLEGPPAARSVPGQLRGAGRGDRGQRRLGHRDQAGEHHQPGGEDQELKIGQAGGRADRRQGVHHRDRVDRQLASSRAWRPNISRSSSGSAWS